MFIATRSRATTLHIVLYSIATGSLVSLFRCFPRLRAERGRRGRKSGGGGEKAIFIGDRCRIRDKTNVEPRLCPRFHVLCRKFVRCARAFDRLVSCGGCSCREIADHGRGVKSRLSSAVPTCSRFVRISAGVSIRGPRAFFIFFFFSFSCARRFLFSPQLSRIG